ncbi:MAG: hypothetical protein ACPG5U_06095 [Planktomarina sp.]
MFTIEHGFDASTVTLVDDTPDVPLKEDVAVQLFEDCVVVKQWDARTNLMRTITLSLNQVRDLTAALDLPEGVYQLEDI